MHIKLVIFCVLLCSTTLLGQQINWNNVDRQVVFGDSLSDAGNTHLVTKYFDDNLPWIEQGSFPVLPGWPQLSGANSGDFNNTANFSNGKMWWDYLTTRLNHETGATLGVTERRLTYNPYLPLSSVNALYENNSNNPPSTSWNNFTNGVWAWGGAKVANDTVVDDDAIGSLLSSLPPEVEGFVLPSVQTQIQEYVDAQSSFRPSDVVYIWAGANDYFLFNAATDPAGKLRDFISADPPIQPTAAFTESVASEQVNNVQTLLNHGAKNIVVMTLPDMGKTPAAVNGEFDTYAFTPTDYTNTYNSTLTEGIAAIDPGDANIIIVDIQAAFDDIIANAGEHGFDLSLLYDNGDPETGNYAPQSVILDPNGNNPSYNSNVTIGSEFADYETEFQRWLFWDHVHPTQAGHQLIADAVFAQIIPEPTTLILLAGGAVAVLARRRPSVQR